MTPLPPGYSRKGGSRLAGWWWCRRSAAGRARWALDWRSATFSGAGPTVKPIRLRGKAEMEWSAEAILSLIATLVVGVVFVMMVSETISVARGTDPVTNHVRGAVRRYPRVT